MQTFFTFIFIAVWILGICATFIPALPASAIIWAGAWLYGYLTGFSEINFTWLVALGLVAFLAGLVDNLAGAWGNKRYGGSKQATWGAFIGSLVGLFLGPIGILIGPLAGAFIGEFFFARRKQRQEVQPVTPHPVKFDSNRKNSLNQAIDSTQGTLIGLLLGIGVKLAIHFLMGLAVLIRIIL